MNKLIIYIAFLFSNLVFTTKAQSAFDNKTLVTTNDGVQYQIIKLGQSGQSLRVQNKQNTLFTEVAKYADTRSETARITELYPTDLATPLNKLFNKTRLLAFKNTRLKLFGIVDRTGTIKEVYFYISKGTAITVDELRKMELMIKAIKIIFAKYVKSSSPFPGRPSYMQVKGATIDDIPEFNGIPYFAINTFIDFDYAYRAEMQITGRNRTDTVWTVPTERGR